MGYANHQGLPQTIAITTKDRPACLHETLRSLRASVDMSMIDLHIIDDDSTTDDARCFLYGTKPMTIPVEWPAYVCEKLGVDVIDNPIATPLAGAWVTRQSRVGVVNTTAQTIRRLLPSRQSIILIQDDVVFKAGWLEKMQASHADLVFGGDIWRRRGKNPCYTAQAVLLRISAWHKAGTQAWENVDAMKGCDQWLHRIAQTHNLTRELIDPAVVQHIGIESIVRANRQFQDGEHFRITTAQPPYAGARQ